jgi:hypothetical protein
MKFEHIRGNPYIGKVYSAPHVICGFFGRIDALTDANLIARQNGTDTEKQRAMWLFIPATTPHGAEIDHVHATEEALKDYVSQLTF